VIGGAAIGIGAGLAWTEIFRTNDFEGDSGMLVFFTCMPLGAMIGALGDPFPVRSRYPRHRNRDRTRAAAGEAALNSVRNSRELRVMHGILPQSGGSAWAAVTVPGTGPAWYKTAAEATSIVVRIRASSALRSPSKCRLAKTPR
jgi:hypothetical protein